MNKVLVIFQADTIETEQLALAAGVGAVEAEGSIRLRRLVRDGAPEVAHKGYGLLKDADLAWAEVIIVGLEAEPLREEAQGLLSLLPASQLQGRRAWTFGAEGIEGSSAARSAVEEALRLAGAEVVQGPAQHLEGDRIEKMKAAGRASVKPGA